LHPRFFCSPEGASASWRERRGKGGKRRKRKKILRGTGEESTRLRSSLSAPPGNESASRQGEGKKGEEEGGKEPKRKGSKKLSAARRAYLRLKRGRKGG